ncbi:MAG: polysaccharide biosynthesis/export family protein [Pseudomonadota bacterium]
MRSKFINGLICLVIAAALSACASYKPVDPAFHKILKEPYTLDAGDTLRITVFNQDNLTNTYMVDKAGYVAFPLVGAVAARGKTTKQLERAIAHNLANGFLRDPDVAVEVATYRPFFIMGEVGTSGQYSYVPGMTVQNAIAIAGGYSARAEQENADITRNVNGRIMTGRVSISDPILPGDTIYIRERLF